MQNSVPLLLEEGCIGTDDLLGAICVDPHFHISIHNLVIKFQTCIVDDVKIHKYSECVCCNAFIFKGSIRESLLICATTCILSMAHVNLVSCPDPQRSSLIPSLSTHL